MQQAMTIQAPALSPWAKLVAMGRDIKLAHSVFAMPFALLAMVLSARWEQRLPSVVEVLLIVVCMVLARTSAMAINRFADAAIDARNPRTARRAVPAGVLSRRYMLGAAILCGVGLMVAALGFWFLRGNVWPMLLSPAVLVVLLGYSYTKRFTWLCHPVLGVALALSPLAASIAIEPGYLATVAPWLLAGFVLCWVAGFDVLYALNDVAADQREGLYSLPSCWGVNRALWGSRGLHAIAAALLVCFALDEPRVGWFFAVGTGLTLALLMLEHAMVWRAETKRLDIAFFTVNGIISVVLGGAGIVDAVMALR
jgi:4-hydroxybenzoate polyprenyltransferase